MQKGEGESECRWKHTLDLGKGFVLGSEAEDLSSQVYSRILAYEAGQIEGKVVRLTPDRTIDIASDDINPCFDMKRPWCFNVR